MILAAGEGQRLRPFTANRPKAMISIAGKPILHHVIQSVAESGIRSIVLVVGYKKEQVYDYMGSGEKLGADITYVTQEKQLGTAHALARARGAVGDEFLVLPGDNLVEAETIARFAEAESPAMLVKMVDDPSRYGVVTMSDGAVTGIVEKPELPKGNIVNAGIYAFNKEIFDFIQAELDIPAVLNNMLAQDRAVHAHPTEGVWLDVVYPWDILSLNNIVIGGLQGNLAGTIEPGVAIRGSVSVGEGTVIRSNSYVAGPAVIGANCDIGPNVCLLSSTSIGDNVVIAPFTEVRNSVIGSDVHIGSGCIIQDSVIDQGCVIRGRFTACAGDAEVKIEGSYHSVWVGAMVGGGCSLGCGVVARPGTIIGNNSRIQPLKLVGGRLPDGSLVE